METEQPGMVNKSRNPNSGRFEAKHQPEDFIGAIRELGGMASTTEIAEAAGAKRRTAHYHLTNLRDEDRISSRKVGGSLLWIADEDTEDET